MKTLTLRIYLTVVAVLLLFAFASTWLFQRHVAHERLQERFRAESVMNERLGAWADLIQRSLPPVDASREEQAVAVREWSERLHIPLALHDVNGERLGAADSYLRREQVRQHRGLPIKLEDGRTLWVMRGLPRPPAPEVGAQGLAGKGPSIWDAPGGAAARRDGAVVSPLAWPQGLGWVLLLALLFVAVAGAAWPVARALTRRLNALKKGVEQFGAGQLHHRVDVSGSDEVAAVARSFNQAAERIESLVRSHQTFLANASHELRSPLTRMKMALSLLEGSEGAQRERLRREVRTNMAELDALVEEVLLASRLEAHQGELATESIDLLGLVAEEAARVDASVEGQSVTIQGDERLLRRALRNLLENALRYGVSASAADDIAVQLRCTASHVELRVCDRGPGVPAELRERIFEPFYRLPGHAERVGGVGLGLSLVRQIAQRHGGDVRCEARSGGGSVFVFQLPLLLVKEK